MVDNFIRSLTSDESFDESFAKIEFRGQIKRCQLLEAFIENLIKGFGLVGPSTA